MVTGPAVATDLFLGGWHGPFLPESLGWIWFLIKSARCCSSTWMRWTLPRHRHDQLMAFGWKILRRSPSSTCWRRRPACCISAHDVFLLKAVAVIASLLVIVQRNRFTACCS
jgi:hypothetical protein